VKKHVVSFFVVVIVVGESVLKYSEVSNIFPNRQWVQKSALLASIRASSL
jgi:hypothetical protein